MSTWEWRGKTELLVNVSPKPSLSNNSPCLHFQGEFKLRTEHYFFFFLVSLFWKTSIPVMVVCSSSLGWDKHFKRIKFCSTWWFFQFFISSLFPFLHDKEKSNVYLSDFKCFVGTEVIINSKKECLLDLWESLFLLGGSWADKHP